VRRRADALIPLEVSILEAAVALHKRGTTAFHGYAIAKVVKTQADRRLLTAYGTLYRALHRLEHAGLIESFWEDPAEAEVEGRPRRRLYRLRAAAEVALARARAQQRASGRLRALTEGFNTRGGR
jgi:DNA-binding PadR family transcriptional regulator